MLVRFKRLHPDAVVPFKKYKEDFCYDVVATGEQEIAPNVWKYGIGLAFEIQGKPEVWSSRMNLVRSCCGFRRAGIGM